MGWLASSGARRADEASKSKSSLGTTPQDAEARREAPNLLSRLVSFGGNTEVSELQPAMRGSTHSASRRTCKALSSVTVFGCVRSMMAAFCSFVADAQNRNKCRARSAGASRLHGQPCQHGEVHAAYLPPQGRVPCGDNGSPQGPCLPSSQSVAGP
eukprot:scaffold2707_cov417-Prasinococcus_capsulatus_cf.AAC.5